MQAIGSKHGVCIVCRASQVRTRAENKARSRVIRSQVDAGQGPPPVSVQRGVSTERTRRTPLRACAGQRPETVTMCSASWD